MDSIRPELSGCQGLASGQGGVKRRTRFATVVKVVVPIVLIGFLLSQFDWARARVELAAVPPLYLLLLFAAMVVELGVSTVKWSYALRMHNLRYPLGYLWRALCSGFFLNAFLPSAVGGDVYRVYKTLPTDGFQSRALSAVLIERAAGLLTLLAFGAAGAFVIADEHRAARVYCDAMIAVTIAGVLGIVALERGWLTGLTAGWDRFRPLRAVHHSMGLLKHRGREWLLLILGSALFQAMSIAILFCLFALLSANATLAECAFIAALVGLAAVLPISINGIGVMEGALVAGAVMVGIDYDKAVLVAFLRRMLNLSLAAACGLLHAAGAGRHGRTPALVAARAAAPPTAPAAAPPPHHAREEESLRTELLENTHDAIIVWEMDGGGIRYFNRAAERLYGFSRTVARGRVTHELLKTELAGGIGELERALARFGVWVGELRHMTRDGRRIQVDGRLALMSQRNGRWLVLEVNRDISDRKAAEAARLEMMHQLKELRNRTVGETV